MPANVVKSPEQKRLWAKAKKRADDEGRTGDWAYAMGVFKRMGGLSKSLRKASTGAGQPIHTTQVQPAWVRIPGAASMLRQRHQRTATHGPEEQYFEDLYTAKRMPQPRVLISDGGPFLNGYDVVRGLPFAPADEMIWAQRIDDWVGRATDNLGLRRALFANLRDYPEVDPILRAELARRALAMHDEKRAQAGDFMVKANPSLFVGDFAKAFGARQSTRGQQAGVPDRKPKGVGRHPGRALPPGKAQPPGQDMERPKAPPTPTKGRDTGINEDADTLDTAGLETPEDGAHIQKKLESLVNELHALHEHMDDDDDHLVQMHNAIKDKMRDAYNDASPDGLREVQHLIHHFHEIVMGAPEPEGDDDGAMGPPQKGPPQNGAPQRGPPMAMKKSGIYIDFRA